MHETHVRERKCRTTILSVGSALVAATCWLCAASAQLIPVNQAPPGDVTSLLADQPAGGRLARPFRLAVVGDLILSTPVAEPANAEHAPIFSLLRNADFAVANAEGPISALDAPGLEPVGNGMLLMAPSLAPDFAAMGLDMVSLANNHLTDWGPAGVKESIRLLDAAGVGHAGAGSTLEQARAPGFKRQDGVTVAMVATASTFKPSAMANDAIDAMPSRAGISVLRTKRVALVSPAEMATLKTIAARQSFGRNAPPAPQATEVSLSGESYRVSKRTGYAYEVNRYDRFGVLKAVHDAKTKADLVIFTIHAHESSTGLDDDNPVPADFLPILFHDAINAGADVVVGGGPHAMRGIEIYKGRPIFYGVGVFFLNGGIYASQELQQDIAGYAREREGVLAPSAFPRANGGNPRNWYDGVISLIDYANGRARRITLIPLDLRPDAEKNLRGDPRIATGARATEILKILKRNSQIFNTIIRIDAGRGYIDLP